MRHVLNKCLLRIHGVIKPICDISVALLIIICKDYIKLIGIMRKKNQKFILYRYSESHSCPKNKAMRDTYKQ